MLERLQKILSVRGIASRRQTERLIEEGLVSVNGKKAIVGQKADPNCDDISVRNEPVSKRTTYLYYVMNKASGVVVTTAEGSRISGKVSQCDNTVTRKKSLCDVLPEDLRGKVFPVGRLDEDSTGLLLLTNDGALANRLMHPRYEHEKEYLVQCRESIFDGALDKVKKGVLLDGEKTRPALTRRIDARTFSIIIREGKNRQIRRMCSKVGSEVTSLKRVRIATLSDPSLKEGEIRPLTNEEITSLRSAVLL